MQTMNSYSKGVKCCKGSYRKSFCRENSCRENKRRENKRRKDVGRVLSVVLKSILLFIFIGNQLVAKERVVGMGQSVYEALSEAQILAEKDDFSQALDILEAIKGQLSSYESAHIHNLKASIYQQNDQFDLALNEYSLAINQDDLPSGLRIQLLSQLSQLHLLSENYSKALLYARQVIKENKDPYPDANVLAAQASYYLEDYVGSRSYIEQAISLDSEGGKPPKENWLLLANAVYYALNDFDQMLSLQYKLLDWYPKPRYLINLSAIYGELNQSMPQLALLESVFEGGYISDQSSLQDLANLMLIQGIPYKSALILEDALNEGTLSSNQKNLEILSRAWYMAGEYEKSLAPLLAAAKMSNQGNLYVRLAGIYTRLARWENVVKSLNEAIKKGRLSSPGNAYLTRGIAQFKLKQYEKAKRSFDAAEKIDNTRKMAQQWQAHMQQEMEKIDALVSR